MVNLTAPPAPTTSQGPAVVVKEKGKKKSTRGVERSAIEMERETTAKSGIHPLPKRKIDGDSVDENHRYVQVSYLIRMSRIMVFYSRKRMKPTRPGGLLPKFETGVETPDLWKKTVSQGQGVVTMAQTNAPSYSENFTDSYGGIFDEDDSQEAAAQTSTTKASQNTRVCQPPNSRSGSHIL